MEEGTQEPRNVGVQPADKGKVTNSTESTGMTQSYQCFGFSPVGLASGSDLQNCEMINACCLSHSIHGTNSNSKLIQSTVSVHLLVSNTIF